MLMMEEIGPNQILDLLLHMQQLIATDSFALFVEPSKDTSCKRFLFLSLLIGESNEEHERMTRSFLVFYQ